jgi:hypothetical protein
MPDRIEVFKVTAGGVPFVLIEHFKIFGGDDSEFTLRKPDFAKGSAEVFFPVKQQETDAKAQQVSGNRDF